MLNTLLIWPGLLSTLYTCSDNQSAVPQLHFLASWTSFGMKRKSTRVFKKNPKVKILLEININTNHGDAWPAEQIMALSAASSGIVCP
jgi:hypothetical protein